MRFLQSRRVRIALLLAFLAAACVVWRLVVEDHSHRLTRRALEQVQLLQLDDLVTNGTVFGIQVFGSNDFRLQIARSLALLKSSDPEIFMRVTNAVGIVREDDQTPTASAAYFNKPPLVRMNPKTAFYSLTWCTAALAHESRHIELRRQRGEANPMGFNPNRPRYSGDDQREQRECVDVEIRVLKKIGAPPRKSCCDKKRDGEFNLP